MIHSTSLLSAALKLAALLACFALGSLLAWGAEPRGQVRLKERFTASGPTVRLGDVAEFGAIDDATVSRMSAIRLAPAPRPGDEIVLTAREIQDVLELSGLGVERIHVYGASAVRISTPAAPTVVLPRKPAATTPGVAKANPAQPAEPQLRQVVYVSRAVQRGQVLTENDVAVQWVDAAKVPGDALLRAEDALGWETTRSLNPNQPVTTAQLRRPILVQRNDIVKVVARASGVRVTVDAKAIGEGSLGDLVEVEHLDRRERLTARITGRGTVEIYARGPTVASEPAATYPVQPATYPSGGVR